MGRAEFLDFVRPRGLLVVDHVVGAKGARDFPLTFCSGRRNDSCAFGLCDLDGGQSDPAGGGVDEDPVAWLDVGAVDESAVGRGSSDEEACCVFEAPAFGDGEEGDFRSEDVGCVCALGSAEDAITDLEFRLG